MPLILPNDIANGQDADGDRLQQNYRTIEDWANSEAIVRDGSVAMVNPLLLPGAPVATNQAATKGYVDGVIGGLGGTYATDAELASAVASLQASITANTNAITANTNAINAANARTQANVALVTTDASGGFRINLNSSLPGGFSIAAMLSTQNPANMEVVLTIWAADADGFSLIARHGNGNPVANAGLTIHWQVA